MKTVHPDPTDIAILSQVLHVHSEDGGFTVVAPMTTLSTLVRDIRNKPKDLNEVKRYVRKNLMAWGENIDHLLDKFIEKNKEPVKLELKSSQKDGYLIDYDGKFDRYFGDEGGGWHEWYEENPKAHGLTRVSLPAYDKKTGLVLVYKGTQGHWLAGSGFLILYKYQGGKLEEQARVTLWVS